MATTDLGRHLYERLGNVVDRLRSHALNLGETYVLGDRPLVLLTALWSGIRAGAVVIAVDDAPVSARARFGTL